MIRIRFTDPEAKNLAMGRLTGRFTFESCATGEMLVPEGALGFLATENISFQFEGPGTREQTDQTRRNPSRTRQKSRAMSTADFKHFCLHDVDGILVIEMMSKDIQGPDVAKAFIAELMTVVEEDDGKPILLNLGRTIHFSSMGYAALFKLVKRAKERQLPVKFCNVHPDVRVGADLVGLPLVVEIYDSEDSALDAFSPA
jgi:anti-anti-sigma regulatory factor